MRSLPRAARAPSTLPLTSQRRSSVRSDPRGRRAGADAARHDGARGVPGGAAAEGAVRRRDLRRRRARGGPGGDGGGDRGGVRPGAGADRAPRGGGGRRAAGRGRRAGNRGVGAAVTGAGVAVSTTVEFMFTKNETALHLAHAS